MKTQVIRLSGKADVFSAIKVMAEKAGELTLGDIVKLLRVKEAQTK